MARFNSGHRNKHMARPLFVVVTTTPDGRRVSDPMLKGNANLLALEECTAWRKAKTTHSVIGSRGDYTLRHLGKPVGSIVVQPADADAPQADEPAAPPPAEPEGDEGYHGYHVTFVATAYLMAESRDDAESKVITAMRRQRHLSCTTIAIVKDTQQPVDTRT